jgi:hypothetical protein
MTFIENIKTTDDGPQNQFIQHVNLDGGDGKPSSVAITDENNTKVSTFNDRLNVESRDTDTYVLFSDMLKELKKINLHLSLINDVMIQNKDLEG